MTEIINFNEIDVPCLHRIHFKDNLNYKSPQWIQWKLGFSIGLSNLERKIIECINSLKRKKYDVKANGKIPITFDDGYKDILYLEKNLKIDEFYDFFQPIIFLPVSILMDKNALLWFDKLYYILSVLSEIDLKNFFKKYELKVNKYKKIGDNDLVLNLANEIFKKQLRSFKNKKQHKFLDNIIYEFKINLNCELVHKELYLNLKDIKYLLEHNWILGSHGFYHHKLKNINMSELRMELAGSLKKMLELGGRPFLAFPDGSFNKSIVECALKVGFSHLFTLYSEKLVKKKEYLINRVIWQEN